MATRADLAARVRQLRAGGRRVVEELSRTVASRSHGTRRSVVAGSVHDTATAEAAVAAVLRGAHLVLYLDLDPEAALQLREDLSRAQDDGAPAAGSIDTGIEALVGHLAEGVNVAEAASRASMSTRSAYRELARLREIEGVDSNTELVMRLARPLTPSAGDPQPAMVGRVGELAAAAATFDAGRSLVVTGDPGVGKSALVAALTAGRDGATVTMTAFRTLASSPYGVVRQALGGRLPADRTALLEAVLRRCDGALVVLDDSQWIDDASFGVMRELAPRVQLCAVVRSGDPGAPRMLDLATEADFDIMHLHELDRVDAAQLVRRLAGPQSSAADVGRVLRRTGGNPLLIEQLFEEGSEDLASRVRFALDQLPEHEVEGVLRLAVAGRAVQESVVGSDLERAVRLGLVERCDAGVRIRHDLVSDEVSAAAGRQRCQRAAAHLAQRVDPAPAASLWVQAGAHDLAVQSALDAAAAASGPADRATHLQVAIASAAEAKVEGSVLTVWVVEAIEQLFDSGDPARALALLDAQDELDLEPGAVELLRARLLWSLGDPEGARRSVEQGMVLCPPGGATEVGLRVEGLRLPIRVDFDAAEAVRQGTSAVALARSVGVGEAEALTLLGSAHLISGDDRWRDCIEEGLAIARESGQAGAELEAANALAAAHLLSGELEPARVVAADGAATAEAHGRQSWGMQFGVLAHFIAWLEGDLEEVRSWGRRRVDRHRVTAVHLAYVTRALAEADAGRDAVAAQLLEELESLPLGDPSGQSLLHWARGELHWLFGRPREALASVSASLSSAVGSLPVRPLAESLRAWCQLETGQAVQPVEASGWSSLEMVSVEAGGVAALAEEDPARALARFEEVLTGLGDTPRFELRARWGRVAALRRLGRTDEAVAELRSATTRARELGLLPLAGRFSRVLRELEPENRRAATGPLTPRQAEVMELVVEGLTSREIAIVLGISPATVDSHIRVAVRELGASNRRHAVLLLRRHETDMDG